MNLTNQNSFESWKWLTWYLMNFLASFHFCLLAWSRSKSRLPEDNFCCASHQSEKVDKNPMKNYQCLLSCGGRRPWPLGNVPWKQFCKIKRGFWKNGVSTEIYPDSHSWRATPPTNWVSVTNVSFEEHFDVAGFPLFAAWQKPSIITHKTARPRSAIQPILFICHSPFFVPHALSPLINSTLSPTWGTFVCC